MATGAAASSGPTFGVGGGFGGNGWSGGAGLSFDLASLFQKAPEQTAKVYRYSVKMQDGSKRDGDSALDLLDDACVSTIDSSQASYPRLMASNAC